MTLEIETMFGAKYLTDELERMQEGNLHLDGVQSVIAAVLIDISVILQAIAETLPGPPAER